MRVGSVPYLNGRPLVHRLDNEPGIEVVYDVPSSLARMLANGEIAAGLVSSAACFFNPRLKIMPGISISCIGPAESVRLFYAKPVEDLNTVALDTSSMTSVLLARIILRERYGLSPEFIDLPPYLPEMLESCDAAMMIGDPAMRAAARSEFPSLDLGAEWHELTGLPFVFAVWAVNPGLASDRLVGALKGAKEMGLASLEEIARMESLRLDLPKEVCLRYLAEIMSYDLTDDHLTGLRLFYEKAGNCGCVPEGWSLSLYEPGRAIT